MGVWIGKTELMRGGDVYFAAEIGINHNGDIEIAKELIDVAVEAGCNIVKFQKRNPDLCIPEEQKKVMRETPWGIMTYLEYKYRLEFGRKEYDIIDKYCRERNIDWFASCWDEESVDFISQYDVPAFKVPSAVVPELTLLKKVADMGKTIIMSSGMVTMEELDTALSYVDHAKVVLCHCVSSYPAPVEELNLSVIPTYLERYPDIVIGYSGHEVILPTTYVAAALGAVYIERHITLDRSMWGTDQAASVEPYGLRSLVRKTKAIKKALGDGRKRIMPSELGVRRKLCRIRAPLTSAS